THAPPEQLPTPLVGVGQMMGQPTQLPVPLHTSWVVHSLPSLHAVPAGAQLLSHAQSAPFQKPILHGSPVRQCFGGYWTMMPAGAGEGFCASSERLQAATAAPRASHQRQLFMHPAGIAPARWRMCPSVSEAPCQESCQRAASYA